jgi:hypothetical protein
MLVFVASQVAAAFVVGLLIAYSNAAGRRRARH